MRRDLGPAVLAVALLALLTLLAPASAAPRGGGDCDLGGDASNGSQHPSALPGPMTCFGRLDPEDLLVVWTGDIADWYGVPLQAGQPFQVRLADLQPDQGVPLCLRPPSEAWFSCEWPCCDPAVESMTAGETGLWRVAAQPAYAGQEYRLDVTAQPVCPAPTRWQVVEGFLPWNQWAGMVPADPLGLGLHHRQDTIALEVPAPDWCATARLTWDGPADVDLRFDGHDTTEVSDVACWAGGSDVPLQDTAAACYVPPGATHARIRLALGGPTHYRFEYGHS